MTGTINVSDKISINILSPIVRILLGIIFCAQRAREKFGAMIGDVELSQEDIAKTFEISRQTVSRQLNELQMSELITYAYGGKIRINSKFYFVNKIDLSAVKNFKLLSSPLQILFIILEAIKLDGTATLKKQDISELLNGLSKQSVGSHLNTFVSAGLIKYKYSGKLNVNPDFFYKGNGEEIRLNELRQNYLKFKSDM